jgi:hypothetical protein
MDTILVKLLQPHTDRGMEYPAGATIRLRPNQVERLRRAGIVASASDEPASAAAGEAEDILVTADEPDEPSAEPSPLTDPIEDSDYGL